MSKGYEKEDLVKGEDQNTGIQGGNKEETKLGDKESNKIGEDGVHVVGIPE